MERPLISNLTMHPKAPKEKEKKIISQKSRWQEIIEIRTEINKIRNKKL